MFKILKNNFTRMLVHGKEFSRRSYSQKSLSKYPKRIFSGIQPTGNVHIGNYLGAIKKWLEFQDSEETCLWSIVDMHSITLPQDPKQLKQHILMTTATLLACGIDPNRSILFQQSTISMQAELCWILNCMTSMARLARLPQFKEKSEKLKNIPLGLYIYPVLQAADILLYRGTHVPVGQDQIQHLQLAQQLARAFNNEFGETFPIPQPITNNQDGSTRIMSLRDPTKKMSKSSAEFKSRLELMDEPSVLRNKVKKAVTDFTSEVTYDPVKRPSVANLIIIHSLLSGKSPEDICTEARDLDTGMYKLVLADLIIEKLSPIRERLLQLSQEPQYLEEVLKEGGEKAAVIATECWLDVRNKIGFGNNTLFSNTKEMQQIEKKLQFV